jgi:hypothetical protein
MRRRIVALDRPIPPLADDLVFKDQQGADGYLAVPRRALR